MALAGIRAPDGSHYPSLEVGAVALRQHWASIHSSIDASNEIAAELTPFIQPINPAVEWQLSRDRFHHMVSRFKDCAPGPDGLCYSAWKYGGEFAIDAIFELYKFSQSGAPLADDFNIGLMVFIPKGAHQEDASSFWRSPEDVRPITLSNSDAKILGSALNKALSDQCELGASDVQNGFVRTRQMSDNILKLECNMLRYGILQCVKSAGCVLLDVKAAFPSLLHFWIEFVLSTMGIPSFFLNSVRALYRRISVDMMLGGRRFPGFEIHRGVRQGCPMSGSIFVLCLDPVLRKIQAVLPSPQNSLSAFADDMAFFSQDLYSTLPVLMRLMVAASFVTGLILNLSKCVIVFYRNNINREEELRKLLDKCLRVRAFAIQKW